MSRSLPNPALGDLLQKIKPFLLQYLQAHGIAATERGKFPCINPEHPDRTPSMNFIPKSMGTKVHCQSQCKATYDIFDAHALLEGRPRGGPGFLHQNVYELARRFGIEFQEIEPTEQELHIMRLWKMYQDAADVLEEMIEENPQETLEHCRARSLHHETCLEFVVGSVPWRAFATRMKARGHEIEDMKQSDISEEMFDRNRITITLRDKNGAVVGFARRWVEWSKEQELFCRSKGTRYPPKFSNTSAKIPFFQKEALLFNLDKARKENFRRLEIFEGYFDVMHAWQSGLRTVTCGLGTGINEFQIMQAQDCGFTHLNLVGDMDPAGIAGMLKAVDTMSGREGLKVTVTFLRFAPDVPVSEQDPDTYFMKYGLEAYLALPEVTGFEWKLHIEMSQPNWDPYQVAKKLVPLIMNERDKIERSRFIKILVQKTQVDEEDVRAEIASRENARIDQSAEELRRRLATAPDSLTRAALIREANLAVSEVVDEKADVSIAESHRAAMTAFQNFEEVSVGLRGWDTGWNFFNQDFDGLSKGQDVLSFAGPPSSGKSALVTNMAVNLLLRNLKGLSVIYHIIDDPRDVAFAKIVSCLTGLPIRLVRRMATDVGPFPHLRNSYDQAKAWVLEQCRIGRLVVKGQDMGTGTRVTERLLDRTSQDTGNKLVYMADSLHNLTDEGDGEDRRMRFANIAHWAQEMADTRRLTMLFTCELTKEGMKDRPRLHMTAETSAIAYAFKAVGMVWNELQVKQTAANTYWTDHVKDPKTGADMGAIKRPIIEVKWEKNKITGYQNSHFYRLFDHTCRVEEMTVQDLQIEKQKATHEKYNVPNLSALASVSSALPNAPPLFLNPPTR